ncbi:tetratricopeptide repeat protein, partial [Bacteroidota bacterium]
MIRKSIFTISLSMVMVFLSLTVNAQQSASYDQPNADYQKAITLYNLGKYSAAQDLFIKVYKDIDDANSLCRINAEYFDAVCALELTHNDGAYKLEQFIKKHPENTNAKMAYFELGKFQYKNGDYEEALKSFKKVDLYSLSKDMKNEFFFKRGYSYFMTDDQKRAKGDFSKIMSSDSKYAASATFYYGHIAYEEGNYDIALENFEKLKNNNTFKKQIPAYLISINHQQKKYDRVIADGLPMYDKASSRDKKELAHLIGDSYYQLGDYEKAIPYLELYSRSSRRSMSRQDFYELGYALYESKDYTNSIRNLQEVTTKEDSLAQNAYYILAYCYIQTNQKQFASNAFSSAYKLDYDKQIAEDALFNYAKLSMEVSKDPYNTSIQNLEKYIEDYPNSPRITEAYQYLASLYLSTNNYKNALTSIEKVKYKNKELEEAYQKILYFRAIELFNLQEYQSAIDLFKKSLETPINKILVDQVNFWIGESFYRLENYWGAIKYFKLFIQDDDNKNTELYSKALYNLAYTYFKRDDFNQAVNYFNEYLKINTDNSTMTNDAYIRLADGYLMRKDYQTAIRYYDKAIKINKVDPDYALQQKSTAQGALGKFDDKIYTLNILINRYKNSPLADDALYEIGTAYLIKNNNNKALEYFGRLVKDYPRSNYAVESLIKTGLIYYNQNNPNQAIKVLKQIIEKYPGTPESRQALSSLRNIYMEENKVDEYYNYANKLSFADITASEQDSISYIAAENIYMENDCPAAIDAFNSYLTKFPEGFYSTHANYYKGECLLKEEQFDDALLAFERVIELPQSRFTENALMKAGEMNYRKKNYEKALEYYVNLEEIAQNNNNRLLSYAGQMRCWLIQENHKNTIDAAKKLLQIGTISDELINEAHITLARCYMVNGDLTLAQQEYKIAEKQTNSEIGAESKYNLAFIAFKTNKLKESEDLIFELVDKYSAYDYWVAKSFILLSDIYMAQDNIFQAKQTLQ